MATETDIRIARAVALKAAVELVNGSAILLADIESKTNELAAILLANNPAPVAQAAPLPDNDPGPIEEPPAEWPEDEALAPPTGPAGQAAPTCKCGSVMEFTKGEDWTAYFCPNQTKSREKRIQDEQKLLHPPVWL